MDMANVAVSTLVAGPMIGGLGPTLPSFRGCHGVFPGTTDMVLRSIDQLLTFCRGVLTFVCRVPSYERLVVGDPRV